MLEPPSLIESVGRPDALVRGGVDVRPDERGDDGGEEDGRAARLRVEEAARSGVWRLRLQAVRPLNGAVETSVSAMAASFANAVGSTEEREPRSARVRLP